MAPRGMEDLLHATPVPWGGEIQPGRGSVGGRPPHGPPNLRGSFYVVLPSKFTDVLGLIACKLITVFLIFFHVVIQTCTCFLFGIPPFEELQDSSTPRVFRVL